MKNKKNNQMLLMITLLSGLMILLNGCSLAKKEAENDTKDTLIGAFITDDCLDLFDMDAYLNDNASKLLQNSDIVINDSAKYMNPLYATIERNNSEDPSDWDISFDGIKGLNLLAPFWTDENGNTSHVSKCSDGVCDINTNINVSDDVNETTLSATIYIIPGAADRDFAYYVNPVYQTADGKIYVVADGSGFSTSLQTSEGENMSTSFSDQTDFTEKGITKTNKSTVTTRFATMYEPIKITLTQMNDKNKIVKQEEFSPGKLPEQLTAKKDTAYFIIKTEKRAPDGSKLITRSIHERENADDEDSLETFYAMDNGIVSKQYTEIIWDN